MKEGLQRTAGSVSTCCSRWLAPILAPELASSSDTRLGGRVRQGLKLEALDSARPAAPSGPPRQLQEPAPLGAQAARRRRLYLRCEGAARRPAGDRHAGGSPTNPGARAGGSPRPEGAGARWPSRSMELPRKRNEYRAIDDKGDARRRAEERRRSVSFIHKSPTLPE